MNIVSIAKRLLISINVLIDLAKLIYEDPTFFLCMTEDEVTKMILINILDKLSKHPKELSFCIKNLYNKNLKFSSIDLFPYLELMDQEARELVIFNLDKTE